MLMSKPLSVAKRYIFLLLFVLIKYQKLKTPIQHNPIIILHPTTLRDSTTHSVLKENLQMLKTINILKQLMLV